MAQRVAVLGAGIVGLSTAWFLQERGRQVTVYDRHHVGAGSSSGNAGWLTPVRVRPLAPPAVRGDGVRAVLSGSSPAYVPRRLDPRLIRFLLMLARSSTARRWEIGMQACIPLDQLALDAFDELTDGDVDAHTYSADPFLACSRTAAEGAALTEELEHLRAAGHDVRYDVLTGQEVRAAEPTLSPRIGSAVRLHGQRYLDPSAFVQALAAAVRARGGHIMEATTVTDVVGRTDGVRVRTRTENETTIDESCHWFDVVVLAHGAWLGRLARRFGVRQPVQAGRGYSFSVSCERLPRGPVYFPTQRVACTPLDTEVGPRLRVSGVTEFRGADAALDPRRIAAIVEAAQPLLSGVDLGDRCDEWVGSGPCTPDGLPLIGATSAPRVFVAGGHGMWGVALAPVTGKLLADRIVTGSTPAELVPFDPLR